MKRFQVREKIGADYHVYAEFKDRKDARRYMSKLSDPSAFDIKVVES